MSLTNGVVTALPAPQGYVVDFANPQRMGDTAIYWSAGVGMLVSALFMAQRLYVCLNIHRKLGIDDICLIIAWGFCVGIQAIIIRGAALKFIGVHAWEMPIEQYGQFVKYDVYLNPIVYATPSCLAKMVLLIFYIKLQNSQKWFRWSIYTTMFISIGYNVGIFFSSIFACSPIEQGWNINITIGTCINRVALFEATAALGVITDVLVILIPIPMVLKLQLSRKKKAGLLAMFSVGSATVITSIVRLFLLVTALGDVDQTWGAGPVSAWVCVEANLLVICASLPTLRLFLKSVAPGFMSSIGGSKGTSGRLGPNGSRSHRLGSNPKSRSNRSTKNYSNVEDEIALKAFVAGDVPGKDLEEGVQGGGQPATGYDANVTIMRWSEDSRSDQGIIQTKTMQVSYSR